ncbi:circadian clock protein KaiC [Alkalihalobacillus sp. MEB130]|uniref:ATPase domain-containing protein n=1 Tax=Alkalihalobacillus sp. MEB130 TaxID=2976704 RepID=UPI0028DEFD6B|nr:ATPase domain-containing protein [Alkalihalobacillus sp. MEB130]MDT8858658.1 circadian clock protein KaiC [Alkalihalobacillus sp. MEB130]
MVSYTATGIEGLDVIVNGGFPIGSSIVVDGAPGTGKTILGMQFLYEGAKAENEAGIYITFEEFPEQIYKEMTSFGWDLKALERENKLRVICLSPEVLISQMKQPNGIFEQIIKEIDCKRVVIDSLNLLHFGIENQVEKREVVFTLRNILRKYSLTSLLIHEQTSLNKEEIPFVSYVVDGVIRLSLNEHNGIYRKRTLEVLKMRGCRINEGEHIYRITDEGVYLVPALSMFEDMVVTENQTNVTTGIPALDKMLSGGIPRGTAFVLDTNSKANYKYILASIVSSRILAGEKVILLLSSLSSLYDLEHIYRLYGVELEEVVKQKRIYFIEHYDRPIPESFQSAVLHVKRMNNDEYIETVRAKLNTLVSKDIEDGEKWFVFYDLNTIVSQRGKDFVKRYFTEDIAFIGATGMSMIALSNFTEIGTETASFLERTSHGVFQTWVDGNYQYFQLKKSPQGNMSRPLLVENIQTRPYIRFL